MESIFNTMNFEYVANNESIVILGDSIEVLKQLKDKVIDLIFADPPYNLGKDFGNGSDNWSDRERYLEWCYRWIDECFRVLKDNGTFYLMNSTQNMPFISVYLQKKIQYHQ